MTLIQLKDSCYYDDDFEYEPILVDESKDARFEEKYEQLRHICESYESFQEVEDFIHDNFTVISFNKRVINI